MNMDPNLMNPPNMMPGQMNAPNMIPPQMNQAAMVPGQMYPPGYFYPPYMQMNQNMMQGYPQMNMPYQYPPGFQMNMPFINSDAMNMMPEVDPPAEPAETEPIHTANPLKIIKKTGNPEEKKPQIEDSSSEEQSEDREEGLVDPKPSAPVEEPSLKRKQPERIDFAQLEEELGVDPMLRKTKIQTIPEDKVDQDIKRKEEMVTKELTEKEILMNKLKSQKAMGEIKVEKKQLKILVKIAKKIPKKKSRLLKQKIKWGLLEEVGPRLTTRRRSSRPNCPGGSTRSRSSCSASRKTLFPNWSRGF